MNSRKTNLFSAVVVHPDGSLVWLYTFRTKEAALNCSHNYCVKNGYLADKGYVRRTIKHHIQQNFDPDKHTEGSIVWSPEPKATNEECDA